VPLGKKSSAIGAKTTVRLSAEQNRIFNFNFAIFIPPKISARVWYDDFSYL
jgi:hypothetical protein